jgi:hypothetical protein
VTILYYYQKQFDFALNAEFTEITSFSFNAGFIAGYTYKTLLNSHNQLHAVAILFLRMLEFLFSKIKVFPVPNYAEL